MKNPERNRPFALAAGLAASLVAGLIAALGLPFAAAGPAAPPRSRGGTWSGRNTGRSVTTMGRARGERRFVVMRPGWHVFAGAGGLFWDPGSFAGGGYSVSSTIYLFPEGDPDASGSTRLDSPFGLFVAGRDLEAEAPAFVSFRIDNSRRFRIAEHSGGGMRELTPWTASEAVAALAEDAEGPVENVLSVDVRDEAAVFRVNDIRVAELPTDGLSLEGVIGIRAGAGLSLHVTEIAIGPEPPRRVAPASDLGGPIAAPRPDPAP